MCPASAQITLIASSSIPSYSRYGGAVEIFEAPVNITDCVFEYNIVRRVDTGDW